jgi:hypothetical protein
MSLSETLRQQVRDRSGIAQLGLRCWVPLGQARLIPMEWFALQPKLIRKKPILANILKY